MAGVKQGTEKRRMYRVIDETGNYTQVLPETSAEQTTYEDTNTSLGATNVQVAIEKVTELAKNGGVTGVKGDKETSYRKGNINLTSANIGALPDSTKYGKTLVVQYTAGSGALSVTLKDQDGTQISSDSVNLPKEMFVESGSVKTCDTPNVPVSGYIVGDKYIDLVLNSQAHVYIKVSDLVDQMSGETTGTGNVISGAVVSGNKITFTKGITAVTSVAGKTGSVITLVKGDVGLGNVDNTADTNKNVATARTLKTARNIKISGDVSGNADFDGSKAIDIAVSLPNKVTAKNGMSVYNVDSKGRITATGTLVEFGKSGANTPSNDLVVGGLFFELQ